MLCMHQNGHVHASDLNSYKQTTTTTAAAHHFNIPVCQQVAMETIGTNMTCLTL